MKTSSLTVPVNEKCPYFKEISNAKNIVVTPAAVVAVDRLTLQADDARSEVFPATPGAIGTLCFSEE